MGKSQHKITNWPQYNQALFIRGSLTFLIDKQAIKSLRFTEHHGRRGLRYIYSDVSIETQLVVKGIFNLSLRALEVLCQPCFPAYGVP